MYKFLISAFWYINLIILSLFLIIFLGIIFYASSMNFSLYGYTFFNYIYILLVAYSILWIVAFFRFVRKFEYGWQNIFLGHFYVQIGSLYLVIMLFALSLLLDFNSDIINLDVRNAFKARDVITEITTLGKEATLIEKDDININAYGYLDVDVLLFVILSTFSFLSLLHLVVYSASNMPKLKDYFSKPVTIVFILLSFIFFFVWWVVDNSYTTVLMKMHVETKPIKKEYFNIPFNEKLSNFYKLYDLINQFNFIYDKNFLKMIIPMAIPFIFAFVLFKQKDY